MKTLNFLPAVLALGLLSACSEGETNAAGNAMDAAKNAAGSAGDAAGNAAGAAGDMLNKAQESLGKFADMNPQELVGNPEKLKEVAGNAISGLTNQLGNVKDLASAKSIADAAGPVVEKLSKLKDLAAGQLPDMSALSGAVDQLKSKFSGQTDIMNALKPLMEKIQGLLG